MRRTICSLAMLTTTLLAACSGGTAADVTSSAPAESDITLTVELERTEVPAGTPIPGVLVFENAGEAIVLMSSECAPIWGIALTNDQERPTVDFTLPCLEEFHIPAGRSEVGFQIQTRLPPGNYETALVMYDADRTLGAPPPAPVTVVLTE